MTVSADIIDGRIYFEAPPTWKDKLNEIPGCRYDTTRRQWHVPLSWASCMAARGVLGDALEISDELDQWAWDQQSLIQVVTKAKADKAPTFGLRPYQSAGMRFLIAAEHAILADDMRLGKTAQAIAALSHADHSLPALVICPATVKHVWMRELARWAPGLSVQIVDGTKAQQHKHCASGADVLIVSWSLAAKLSRLAPYGSVKLADSEKVEGPLNAVGFRTVIPDEIHRAADPMSKQTRAAKYLAHKAHYRWGLSGTPMTDTPAELWSVMNVLAPDDFPRKSTFIDRYCNVRQNYFGGVKIRGLREDTKDEFFSFFDPHFLRRSRAEVFSDLPTETRTPREVDMSTVQGKAYRELKKNMLAEIGGNILSATDPLSLRTRLLQTAAATPVVNEIGEVTALKMPSCKVDAMLEILDEAGGEPVVVFAESRKLIELCSRELDRRKIPHGLVTGQVADADRQAAIEDFQGGKTMVILLTIASGGEGINLSRANLAVFLQRRTRLLDNLQAEQRIFLPDQPQANEIIDVITLNTVEARVHEIAAEKGERLQEVCRDPKAWLAEALG